EIEQTVKRTLDMVRMGGYADRPASKLSGGQQQRIAVARAIAFSPTVILFDEPLSNLDAKLRTEMRVELRELQRQLDVTSVYVTHDQEEALAISDRIIVMDHGVIEQIGSPETIYNRPGSLFVADFVGAANLIEGRVVDGGLFETVGGVRLAVADGGRAAGTTVALRSSYVELRLDGAGVPDGMNVADGTIHRRMFHGDFIQYVVDWPAGQLIVRRPPTEMIEEGAPVRVVFSADHCILL
ncbi:MAG: ABC transporter ATP-binding protein, partial [Proteobacteria bacterium]|nr:ABC transporter ATP-binding protein [Pseudomonadota bacterium]